jgi:hypothetical protein
MKKKNKKVSDRPFTGICALIDSKGFTINGLHGSMLVESNVRISKSAFYGFCEGWQFTRKRDMMIYVSDKLGITIDALMGFYTPIGSSRAEKENAKPENIHKKQVKSNLKDVGGLF